MKSWGSGMVEPISDPCCQDVFCCEQSLWPKGGPASQVAGMQESNITFVGVKISQLSSDHVLGSLLRNGHRLYHSILQQPHRRDTLVFSSLVTDEKVSKLSRFTGEGTVAPGRWREEAKSPSQERTCWDQSALTERGWVRARRRKSLIA